MTFFWSQQVVHFYMLHTCFYKHSGTQMKGVFHQLAVYAFCFIPQMLCNQELIWSNTPPPGTDKTCLWSEATES